MIAYRVPQGSALGALLFLMYISDLNEAISHSLIHHFAGDTNIIFSNKSLKNKQTHQPWLSTDSTMAKSKPYFSQFK